MQFKSDFIFSIMRKMLHEYVKNTIKMQFSSAFVFKSRVVEKCTKKSNTDKLRNSESEIMSVSGLSVCLSLRVRGIILFILIKTITKLSHYHFFIPQQPFPPSSPVSSSSLRSEYHILESSIRQVVHQNVRRDAGGDGRLSAVTTVARKILQEAAEHISAALREVLGGEGETSALLGGVMGR